MAKKTTPEKKVKEKTWEIKVKVTFEFVYAHNAQNVAFALASAGYYVNIGRRNETYIVNVYTDRLN